MFNKEEIQKQSMFSHIRKWAEDRNLVKGSNPQAQMVKLIEEVGELAAGVARGDVLKITDSIGDTVVVLTILAHQYNYNIEHCIDQVWEIIKDRKGEMRDGIWIKEEDMK